MFGKNRVLPPVRVAPDGRYWVQEVFPTLQGEGPWTGWPAVFVRMAGCNLACHFCDTDFESSTWHPDLHELTYAIETAAHKCSARRVVITGGEPLRQPLAPIVNALYNLNLAVQLETAGTLWQTDLEAEGPPLLVCSPKTGTVASGVRRWCLDYKYIIREGEVGSRGIPDRSTQEPGRALNLYYPEEPDCTIWLQPCAEYNADGTPDVVRNHHNTQLTVALCMEHGYRLSLQTHKVVGLR